MGVFLSENYSSNSLIRCTATCYELSVNLGKDYSVYLQVSTYVSGLALTRSIPEVATGLELLALLHPELLPTLTLFTPRDIRLFDSETAGMA